MTNDEAVKVIALMMAAWPQAQSMSNDAADLWVHDLLPLELVIAANAMNRLRHTEDFPPTLHKFLGAYQALAPRSFHEAISAPKRFGHQAPLVKALRASIKVATKAEHANHHLLPSKDCPVCSLHDHDPSGKKHLESCARCRSLGEMVYETLRGEPQ